MKHINFIWISLCLYFYANPYLCQAQKYTIDKELAQQYSETYPEEIGVILDATYQYSFTTTVQDRKKTIKYDEPIIQEKNTERILSFKSKQIIPRYKFYDENSSLKKHKVYDGKGREGVVARNCGNHDVAGIFHSDAKVCLFPLKFYDAGEIQNFETNKTYTNARYFTTIYFQDVFPVLQKTIKIVVPKNIKIEVKTFNFEGYDISEKKYDSEDQSSVIYEYQVKNLEPFFKKESNTPGPSHIYPHLLVLTKSFTDAEQNEKNILSSTQDLYNWYSSLVGELYADKNVLQSQVNKLIQGIDNDQEKIKAIYYWVQDNIRYIAFEDGVAGFRPEEAHEVFQKKYGDCKGMANLTKAMLTLAGFDARLTWIGTDHLAYDYSTPSLVVDNHMVCTVFLEEKKYILDATEKFIAFADNADRIQGRPIMIENGEQFILDQVPSSEKERNLVQHNLTLSIEDDILKGKGGISLNGDPKSNILRGLNQKQSSEHKDMLKSLIELGEYQRSITKLEHTDVTNRDQTFQVDYDLESREQLAKFGEELYIELDPFQNLIAYNIDEERENDVDLGGIYAVRSKIELNIPQGYQISYLPEPLQINTDKYSLKINYQQKDQQIIYQKEIFVTNRLIPKTDFDTWNNAIKQLKEKYEEQIILKKL